MAYGGYTIEEVEDAILATLSADATLSGYVRTFDRLPWERAGEIGRLVKRYPAVLVAYAGGEDSSGNFGVCDHAGRFVVWCAARNLRSPGAAAAGVTASEKGVYEMLDDVLSALHFSGLGIDVISCVSRRVVPLAASPGVTIFSREFEITWRLTYA